MAKGQKRSNKEAKKPKQAKKDLDSTPELLEGLCPKHREGQEHLTSRRRSDKGRLPGGEFDPHEASQGEP